MRPIFLVLAMSATGWSGEFVILENGFRLFADRHESDGSVVRLYSKEGGVTEFAASLIAGYEQIPDPPAPPGATTTSAPAPALTTRELVDRAAKKNGLPPSLVHSVVAAESAYKPDAVSPKGAVGLMQLMPATARAYNVDPRDPAQNVEAGAAYLRELLVKYDGDANRALAAYNAGPGAVAKYNGVPPYAETQNYVQKVLTQYKKAENPAAK